jgi:molybdenum cofactor cytidylyltransferase
MAGRCDSGRVRSMTDSIPESILKIGGILLAAGGSSRLGKPKQLLQFQGRSLIRIAADTLTNSLCRPIVVVLGAETDRSAYEVADLPVGVCANGEWQTGMGSSIRSGLQHLLGNEPDLDAVVIALCDQPLVPADIDSLITEFISSTRYNLADRSRPLRRHRRRARSLFESCFWRTSRSGRR